MLENATDLCDASFGTLATYDSELLAPAAANWCAAIKVRKARQSG
jgi:hypothetical protein